MQKLEQLNDAIYKNIHIDTILSMLNEIDINYINYIFNNKKTLLINSIIHLPFESANKFIDNILKFKNINVDHQDNLGKTALMHCIKIGFNEVFNKLIDYGCNLNLQDKDGETALYTAIDKLYFVYQHDVNKFQEFAYKLIEQKSCNVDIQTNILKKTALLNCVDCINSYNRHNYDDSKGERQNYKYNKRFNEIAFKLIDNGCDVNIRDSSDRTALTNACWGSYGLSDIASKLIDTPSSDLNLSDDNGNALEGAIWCRPKIALKIMKTGRCDLSVLCDSSTLLIISIERKRIECCKYLILNNSCDINLQNRHGKTALILSIDKDLDEITELLLEKKCDVTQTLFDRLALKSACNKNNIKIVNRIIDRYIENHDISFLDISLDITKYFYYSNVIDKIWKMYQNEIIGIINKRDLGDINVIVLISQYVC
ncbi:MAG: hypothetical protein Edafosvirus22_8 [Edafosvirus sp.]|uniref:Ankyrin repeat protein n=1 Tax=Edafosvirus sp. TaxID=2487765 RepID=A0A3G4ZXC1_9VIRU|nr:MAG: hypothetical protein Edafosvirus22_8 [Edafosvirus sp.]